MDSIKLYTAGCDLKAELPFPAAATVGAAAAALAGAAVMGVTALAGEAAAPRADGVVAALYEEERKSQA